MKTQNKFHRHRQNRSLGAMAFIASLSILAAASAQAALTVHYTFDDADMIGTAAQNDQTTNNNDSGEPTGSNGYTTGVTGKFGEAYNVGENAYVPIASGVLPSGTSARTISLWFNQDAAVTGKNIVFGYGGGGGGNNLDAGFEGGTIRFRHYAGYVDFGSGFDFDGTDAGWHHLAVRVNDVTTPTFGDLDVFLDGTLLSVTASISGGTSQTLHTTDTVFRIGGSESFGGGDSFDGSVDELQIYDTALTNADMGTLFAGGVVVPEPSAALLGGLGVLLLLRRRRI